MPRIFEQTPIQTEDGYGFSCNGSVYRRTGEGELELVPGALERCFTSTGWPTAVIAQARADEHAQEHRDGTTMSPLSEFRARFDLRSQGNKAVSVQQD